MYYRRKVLLALIEAFGGTLERTDCQKLLFIFCQHSRKNHYDFFPYKFGSFSLLAYYDKSRLTELGYLQNSQDFQLVQCSQSFIDQLKTRDQALLRSLASKLENLRGRELIRYSYLNFPRYISHSTILTDILTKEEIDRVSFWQQLDETPRLFTLGYEGLTIDAYLDKLITNNILALVDVRHNPNSIKYGFAKSRLWKYMNRVGIEYFHLPELGIPSELRQELDGPETYRKLFQHYETQMLPKKIDAIEQVRSILTEHNRIALTCFEADYLSCHRHKITNHLENCSDFDVSVFHLK